MATDFYELLDYIRQRPAMYLSEKSITLLYGFLAGYNFDKWIETVKNTNPPFGEFNNWVAMKLGFYESTSGWRRMLLKVENGDEEKAFDRFFVLLDEFKQRQAKVILSAVPDATKTWRYQIVDGEKINLPSPVLVQIVKYTDDKGVFVRFIGENGELVDREEYHSDLDVAFSSTNWFIEKSAWKQPET